MKKIAIVAVFFLFLLGALGAKYALAIEAAEMSGVVVSPGGKAVLGVVVYSFVGGEAYGAEADLRGRFGFYLPMYAGAAEYFFFAVSQHQQCYGTKMVFVSPNTCNQINFLCN